MAISPYFFIRKNSKHTEELKNEHTVHIPANDDSTMNIGFLFAVYLLGGIIWNVTHFLTSFTYIIQQLSPKNKDILLKTSTSLNATG